MRNGGLYIIEDLHGHPSYERTLPHVPPTTEVLGGFLSRAQFGDTGAIPTSCWRPLETEIGSIVFFGEDTLTDLRELFNARHGLGTLRGSTIGNRDYLRLFKDRVKQMMRAAAGEHKWDL